MISQLVQQMPMLALFLVMLIFPLTVEILVIGFALKTIPGFLEQEQKRQLPMVLAILMSLLTMWLGCIVIFPLLPH